MSDRLVQLKSSRRQMLRGLGVAAVAAASSPAGATTGFIESLLRKRFAELSPEQIANIIADLEKEYSKTYGKKVSVSAKGPEKGVKFGYGLDLSRCVGCRRCVYACQEENNQSRDPQIQWIRVLRMEDEKGVNLEEADPYYDPESVPEDGYFYMPVQCQQCDNPSCVKACPVSATWKEPDGIVVIDYDWCIGCRCCMAACPYGARRFNWSKPNIPSDQLEPNTHYLGNRPRPMGVVEKCTFCIQRTREGRYPACVEICPAGARKFGNLLDEESEIRYLMRNKRVFVLKEEVGTHPSFFYFYSVA